MARALPYGFFIYDGSQNLLDAEARILGAEESLQLLENMRSIWVKQGSAGTGRMCAEEGKVNAKGAMVALIVMGRLSWGLELGVIETFTPYYWDIMRVGSVFMADGR